MTATSTSVKSSTTIPSPLLPSDVREDLCRYAEAGGFTLRTGTNPWFAALDSVADVEEARAASTVLAELRGRDLPLLQQAAEQLSAVSGFDAPTTVAETAALVALVLRVRGTLAVLHAPVYEGAPDALDAMIAATASSAWRSQNGVKQSWLQRRALTRQARVLAVTRRTRRDALHGALAAAASERADWATLAADGGRPALPSGLELPEGAGQAAESAVPGLRLLADLIRPEHALEDLPLADLTTLLDQLAADEGTLYRLPRLRALRDGLLAHDLDALLAELTAQEAGVTETTALLARATVPQPSSEPQPTTPAPTEPESESAAVAEAEIEAVAESAAVAEAEVIAEAEVEAEALIEATPEAETPAEPEAEITVESEAEVEVEAEVEAAAETTPEAEVEADAAAEPAAGVETPAEPEADPVAEALIEATPEAETPAESEAASAAVDAEPQAEAGPAEAAPAARAARRPRKPAFTPGQPVTAYSAEQLEAVVRWIDSDSVERTNEELLRAAMKEFGFSRLGPRIKEALGAAVAAVRD
ncbi:hypothetical protein [Streptacidiphilus rugosus]|uniref:hypothetical protein n=1 Tax=Streptacidiphilus rugosus TaxID=405783 RepID=UPI00068AA8CF|nr:hypothetical protein [Streptacidiphilus rugosus]